MSAKPALKVFGERYRHPENWRMEKSIIEDKPFCWLDHMEDWYKDFGKHLWIDQDHIADAAAAGKKGEVARKELDRRMKGLAFLACNDRFFLLTELCNRKDAKHPFIYCQCREVEENPDGHIDLWARFHYKSTIITFAGVIQEVLRDPEIRIAIFSVTKPIANAFLAQIKDEFEGNDLLKFIFSDVLYANPRATSEGGEKPSRWSLARGLTVKRKSNPKEATIEAHGLIDAQPTSRHFDLHIYDDIVTEKYLSEEMIRKTTERWELADNLGSHKGVRKQMVGTRYHFADTYSVVLERGSMKPRIYPATDDGTLEGRPVFLSNERWEEIKRDQRSTVASQILLNPVAANEATFRSDMLRGYQMIPAMLNVYILIDPSSGKGKHSDRTAIAVIGIDERGHKFLLDGYRHRMPLSERWKYVKQLLTKWRNHPGVQHVGVGWERYGKDSEIEAIKEFQRREGAFFPIVELNTPSQGAHSKKARIERLEPDFRLGRFFLPSPAYNPDKGGDCTWRVWTEEMRRDAEKRGDKRNYSVGEIVFRLAVHESRPKRPEYHQPAQHRIVRPLKRVDEDGNIYDLTRAFIDEFLQHPFAPHDDLIDAVSRIYDIDSRWPEYHQDDDWEGICEDDPR